MIETPLPPMPTLQDPEPDEPRRPHERRTVRAKEALVTLLVALGLWALLFAPALERRAETGPVGARRTVALAVLRPLTAVSDSLAIGRASEAVMRAFGHDPEAPPGGELDLSGFDLPPLPPIDEEVQPERPSPPRGSDPSPPPRAGSDRGQDEPTEPQPTPEIRTPAEDAKLRVAVVGDSLSQGLGPAIASWFDPGVARVLPLGRQSTGLARQDYFNWRLAMRKIEEEFRPDLVFVMLGSNDNQAQVTPDGRDIPVGSVEWVQAYRQRATEFLREATSNGTHVVWVGIPVVQEHWRRDFYRRVNEIYEETATADPLATYVDAWELFQARDGSYSAYLRNERGVLQQMRAGDGLHLTPTGYGYLARAAIRAAAAAFDLPQRAVTFRI
jgi:hypothetical protein